LTPDSIAACITTIADAVAADIQDCGNTGPQVAALAVSLWNDVTNTTFLQQGALRLLE